MGDPLENEKQDSEQNKVSNSEEGESLDGEDNFVSYEFDLNARLKMKRASAYQAT